MKKLKLIPIILILILLTACGGNKNEASSEAGYGEKLIDTYEKSSETIDDYNNTNQNKFNDLNEIVDE